MKKPYLQKHGIKLGFTVWIVDGKHIRTYLDEEFTNFGQHYRFPFIPKNEFWIDRESSRRKEIDFYVDHLLEENRLLHKGKSYNYALLKADALERRERHGSEVYRNFLPDIFTRLHYQLLKKYSNKIKVWVVDGELVRDHFFLDFTEGGHYYRYRFIPHNEIWLDDDLSLRERKYVLLHELHERNRMAERLQKERKSAKRLRPYKVYCWAHQRASELEHYCRLHPQQLELKLKEELRKSY